MSPDDLSRLRAEYARRDTQLGLFDTYSPFNRATLFRIQNRQRVELQLLRRNRFFPLKSHRILELGCGSGAELLRYLSYGADPGFLHGTDLLPQRVKAARARFPQLQLTCADGQHLPYPPEIFDLVMQYTVFSSVLDNRVKRNLASEIMRVLKPNGMILWYDFWLNPTNPQTRGIRTKEIRALFPNCRFEFRRITLAPPITRKLIKVSWALCHLLEQLRILNTHYLVAIHPADKAANS